MRYRAVCLALLMCPVIAAAQEMNPPPPGPPPPKPPAIVVTGNGEVDVAPTRAVVSLGATVHEKDAATAQHKVSAIIQKSIDALVALGIKQEKIHTDRISLNPVYQPMAPNDAYRHRKIVGYEASNLLQITLDDLTQIGPVIDAAVADGADEIQGVDFQLADDTEATQDALRKAMLQAHAKALAIADAAHVQLGRALEIEEGSVQRIMPMMAMSRMAAADESTPVSPGEIKISAQVTATYLIK